MNRISKISQKSRILLLGVALPMLIVAVLGCLYYHDCRERAIEASVHEARALCLTAESSQQHFEQQWADEIYSRDQLSKWAAADDSHKILSTVPIIAAMNSLSANQKSAGYELKIPALEPRNPENLANEFQAAALHELQTSGLSELVKMDPATNTAHYFRPIKLDQSCLMCHGDSANAEGLWGTTDGTDVTGYAMEGWRAGDLRGAFEIVQSLDAADEASAAAMRVVGGGMIAALFVCGGLSLVVLRSIKADELQHTVSIGSDVAQEVSDNTAHIAAAVEELHSNVRDIAKNAAHASSTAKAVVMRVQSTNERSEALDRSSREIENIVQMIETIAEQTNLLALNATIEAARAGDAGKGFAVVAGEVKSLAQQTSAATSTITSRVASIQGTSTELLSELREMQDIINSIDATQEEIALAVSQQQSATEEISRSVHSVLDSSRSLKTRLHGRSKA